jgi:hypothetical protein
MNANEGVQSFNFEVGQKFKSFKEFESQLKHYQDAKFIHIYRRSSCKIESTKTKQTITNNDLCRYIYEVYFIYFWCIDLKCIINYKLIYNNNNSFNSLCPIMKSLELPGNNILENEIKNWKNYYYYISICNW